MNPRHVTLTKATEPTLLVYTTCRLMNQEIDVVADFTPLTDALRSVVLPPNIQAITFYPPASGLRVKQAFRDYDMDETMQLEITELETVGQFRQFPVVADGVFYLGDNPDVTVTQYVVFRKEVGEEAFVQLFGSFPEDGRRSPASTAPIPLSFFVEL